MEITLSADDQGKPVTFRRHLKSSTGASEWKLDSACPSLCQPLWAGACMAANTCLCTLAWQGSRHPEAS